MISSGRACLRQRQLLQTRDLIQRAALDLVADRGFSSVSVQAISEAAGVSPRTFFNHFRSKEEVLVPDIPDFTGQQRRVFLDATDVDLLTALERLLTDHMLAALDRTGPGRVLHAAPRLSQSSPELLPRLLAVFEAFVHQVADLVAQRTGGSPDDLRCTVVADCAVSTARAAVVRWGRDIEDAGHPDLPTALSDAFCALRGLVRHDATTA